MSQKNVFFVMGEPQIVPFLPLVVKRGFHKSYSFNNNNNNNNNNKNNMLVV